MRRLASAIESFVRSSSRPCAGARVVASSAPATATAMTSRRVITSWIVIVCPHWGWERTACRYDTPSAPYNGPLQLLQFKVDVSRHLRSAHPIHFRPERIIRSALGTLADEDLKARLFVERLSGMITVTSRDTQAVALDQCLKLSRKVHLEIQ